MRGLALLGALLGAYRAAQADCSGKCCPGTNPACNSSGWRTDRGFGTCFCDQACRRTGDCCSDYPSTCPARPCVVEPWSSWSGCSQTCRVTFRERHRHIQQEPSNGAQACPPLVERAGCLEYLDYQGQSCALDRDLQNSNGDPFKCNHQYCVEFLITSLSPHCPAEGRPHARWMQYLRVGFRVCVACQPIAMLGPGHTCRGDGTTSGRDEPLQWQAVGNSRCRGIWTRARRLNGCICPEVHSFVFV